MNSAISSSKEMDTNTAKIQYVTSRKQPPPQRPASSFPTTLAEFMFQPHLDPEGNLTSNKSSIYKTIALLRKTTLSIPNRLTSVLKDAEFVTALWAYLNDHGSFSPTEQKSWPLIPNERSGSWPLPPTTKAQSQSPYLSPTENGPPPVSAYFKSTDGHINQWSFSTRRLNLPVLELVGTAGGAILIDTTRRGKSYPDALRRTLPIWCTVWNQALFSELADHLICDFQGFRMDESEIVQIKARIPRFTDDLKALGLDLETLRDKTKKPVRCVWVNQPSCQSDWDDIFEALVAEIDNERTKCSAYGGVNILICCSASKQVIGAEMSEEGYIQGAGDDSEGWSYGLTAKLFWNNQERLMTAVAGGDDVEEMVRQIVAEDKRKTEVGSSTVVTPTRNLFLAAGSAVSTAFDLIIYCNQTHSEDSVLQNCMYLSCKDGKLGSKQLREKLPGLRTAVEQLLRKSPGARLCVCCSTGKDLSVGAVLMILCCFYADDGSVELSQNRVVDKQFIKQRLAWITSSKPDANPSRATLQAVNSLLIDRPH